MLFCGRDQLSYGILSFSLQLWDDGARCAGKERAKQQRLTPAAYAVRVANAPRVAATHRELRENLEHLIQEAGLEGFACARVAPAQADDPPLWQAATAAERGMLHITISGDHDLLHNGAARIPGVLTVILLPEVARSIVRGVLYDMHEISQCAGIDNSMWPLLSAAAGDDLSSGFYGIGVKTVQRWGKLFTEWLAKNGKLEAFRNDPAQRRVYARELLKWMLYNEGRTATPERIEEVLDADALLPQRMPHALTPNDAATVALRERVFKGLAAATEPLDKTTTAASFVAVEPPPQANPAMLAKAKEWFDVTPDYTNPDLPPALLLRAFCRANGWMSASALSRLAIYLESLAFDGGRRIVQLLVEGAGGRAGLWFYLRCIRQKRGRWKVMLLKLEQEEAAAAAAAIAADEEVGELFFEAGAGAGAGAGAFAAAVAPAAAGATATAAPAAAPAAAPPPPPPPPLPRLGWGSRWA